MIVMDGVDPALRAPHRIARYNAQAHGATDASPESPTAAAAAAAAGKAAVVVAAAAAAAAAEEEDH